MKIGDIVWNKHAGKSNPCKYSIFIGEDEKYNRTLGFDKDGQIKLLRFKKSNGAQLQVLCHSGALDTLKDDLAELREAMQNG